MKCNYNMRLAITGLGMVSSIGRDVRTACASYRAGITRPVELSCFQMLSMDDLDTVSVIGHPVTGLTDGFRGAGLCLHLAYFTLKDIISYSEIDLSDSSFLHETGLFINLSKCRDENYDFYDAALEKSLIDSLNTRFKLKFNPHTQHVFFLGNAGILTAIQKAAECIEAKMVKRVIVMGVDSLVGKADLEYFVSKNRLKTAQSLNGLIPGEAGAAILVEDETSARERKTDILGYIDSVCTGFEKNNIFKEDQNRGIALSEVLIKTLNGAKSIQTIYGDQNGETWRAFEYSSALVKISKNCSVENVTAYCPAQCFGDTGAASGAISICAAIQSFVRHYSKSSKIVVFSRSETGETASALLYKSYNVLKE